MPRRIVAHCLERNLDLAQACGAAGISNDPRLGEKGGLIGLLSSNRLTREEYTLQALHTALFFASEAGRPWYDLHGAEAPPATRTTH